MKSVVLPQVRIEPALRAAVEAVLAESETLSTFPTESSAYCWRWRQPASCYPCISTSKSLTTAGHWLPPFRSAAIHLTRVTARAV